VLLCFTTLFGGPGLPADPDKDSLASSVAGPVQLSLLVLAGAGVMLAVR
jgi:hypothetical protein